MNKTLIIIGREFTTRVRKRSFLVLTLVVPILLAGFYAFLMWMLLKDDTQDRKIAVINQSVLETPFEQINNNTFEYLNTPVDESGASEFLRQHDYYALISIPENIMDHPEIPVYSFSQVPMELKNEIAAQLRKKIEDIKRAKVIAESQVPDLEEQLSATQTPVLVRTLKITDSGRSQRKLVGSRFGYRIDRRHDYLLLYIHVCLSSHERSDRRKNKPDYRGIGLFCQTVSISVR